MNTERVTMETQLCVLFIVQLGYPQQGDRISHEGSDFMANLCYREQ